MSLTPARSLTLTPAPGVVRPLPFRSAAPLGYGVVEAPFQHLTGRTGSASGCFSQMAMAWQGHEKGRHHPYHPHPLSQWNLTAAQQGYFITYALRTGKLRPREVKHLSQSVTTHKRESLDLNPGLSVSRIIFFILGQKFSLNIINFSPISFRKTLNLYSYASPCYAPDVRKPNSL